MISSLQQPPYVFNIFFVVVFLAYLAFSSLLYDLGAIACLTFGLILIMSVNYLYYKQFFPSYNVDFSLDLLYYGYPQFINQSPVKSSSDANKKVSTSMRQRYLAILTKKFKEIKPASEAQTLASQAEMNSYENCNSRSSYINLCVTAVKNIRSTTSACPTNIIPSKNNAISHEAILAGPKAARLIPHPKKVMKKSVEKLEGVKLYEAMLTYKMTEEQLVDNSYPRSTSNRNEASVYYPDRLSLAETTSKSCIRCGSNYKMNKDGSSSSECIYHWGNPFKQRIAGVLTTRYRCCQGDLISMGCSLAKSHVTENFDTLPQGYQKTVTRPLFKNQTHHGIFALDCEMCYTKDGLELTRVTVINENFDVVYESLVKPRNPILDYNTRFSGLSEKDFENLTTTLSEVQTHLLSRFSANSILIGHSLQSDLKALKLIHNVVVDTSIVFPHRRGPPLKRSLKNLMSEYLQKIIQENEEGHDSSEDAKACMELMLWRIKQDFKGVTCK